MKVGFLDDNFVCHCTFQERETPKKAGFSWDPIKKWHTKNLKIAARLKDHFDETAKRKLSQFLIERQPWTGPILCGQGLEPLDFQIDAARFALERNNSYLALDPGLGKTIVAGLITYNSKSPTIYICPPFLTENVAEEIIKWTSGKVVPTLFPRCHPKDNFIIIPDSLLNRSTVRELVSYFQTFYGREERTTTIFIDEAHRFKNWEAIRTQHLLGNKKIPGLIKNFTKIIFLSGTPMPNRPIELFPVLSSCAPETINFMNRFEYGLKYCAGYKSEWGWDFSGASNVKELGEKVKGPFMLRLKKELLKLPPKIEELVILSDKMPSKLAVMDRDILKAHSPEELPSMTGGEIATYRRELGISKIDLSLEYIKSILSETDEDLLIFAYHTAVVMGLSEGLKKYNAQFISGAVPTDKRLNIAKSFQSDPKQRALILQIQAGGVGFNLTKASRVVCVEFSWVPAENEQAIDRAHRFGQKESVTAQYLVYKNSIDREILETNFRKSKNIKHI